jgi:hypothetical protein
MTKGTKVVYCLSVDDMNSPSRAGLVFGIELEDARGKHRLLVAGGELSWADTAAPTNARVRLELEIVALQAVNEYQDWRVVKERALMAQRGGVH